MASRSTWWIVAAAAALLLSPAAVGSRVETAFSGQIVVLKRRPPTRFPSQAAFVRFLQANRLKAVWPERGQEGKWELEFMAFLKRPVSDLELKVRFDDVTDGRRFVAADSIFTPSRGERVLSSKILLKKPQFQPRRKYMMYVLTARNVVLASTRFDLQGKGEHYSGRVEFSDDEAR